MRDPGRGLFMGNRGILHDDTGQIRRGWTNKAWITCRREFKGRKRTILSPHRYTELFFLDEAAALAAGHRPCAECRHADFRRFVSAWRMAVGGDGRVGSIDGQLHQERLTSLRTKRTHRDVLARLPVGSYIELDGAAWLRVSQILLRWTPGGYAEERQLAPETEVTVLTPPSVVRVLQLGYKPVLHASAGDT